MELDLSQSGGIQINLVLYREKIVFEIDNFKPIVLMLKRAVGNFNFAKILCAIKSLVHFAKLA